MDAWRSRDRVLRTAVSLGQGIRRIVELQEKLPEFEMEEISAALNWLEARGLVETKGG